MIRDFIHNIQVYFKIKRIRRLLDPDQKFLRSARAEFLRTLQPQVVPAVYRVPRWSYAMALVVAVVASTGGLAAYADIKDVAPESPLYTLKRASEQTRLALAPTQTKITVHTQLAERRLKEIEKVAPGAAGTAVATKAQTIAPAGMVVLKVASDSPAIENTRSAMVKKLHEDLRHELEDAIDSNKEKGSEDNTLASSSARVTKRGPSGRVCQVLKEAVLKKFIESGHSQQLQDRCAQSQD